MIKYYGCAERRTDLRAASPRTTIRRTFVALRICAPARPRLRGPCFSVRIFVVHS
jgi:hypothetical protein